MRSKGRAADAQPPASRVPKKSGPGARKAGRAAHPRQPAPGKSKAKVSRTALNPAAAWPFPGNRETREAAQRDRQNGLPKKYRDAT